MRRNGFALTDIGLKRRINQDAFLMDEELGLYVVADGMGGHRGGEVASRMCVEEIRNYCAANRNAPGREQLDKGINLACDQIFRAAQGNEELAGMGTTVLALLFKDDTVFIGQVGDSRAYLLHGNTIWQVTEDHSLLNEEIRAGRLEVDQISSYQFKNVITRSVGYENKVVVDIYRRKAKPGDKFLLCSDGLSGLVDIHEISAEVASHPPDVALKRLIDLANARGGDDNITALLCCVTAD